MGGIIPDFSGLPPWGQVIAYGVFALAVFALILAGRFGVKLRGMAQPEKQAEVAAVVVNPEALNRATAAVEALNMTAMSMNAVMRAMVKSDLARARQMDRLATSTERAVDLFGQFVADQHAERVEAEYEDEVERRIKERTPPPPPPRKRPRQAPRNRPVK